MLTALLMFGFVAGLVSLLVVLSALRLGAESDERQRYLYEEKFPEETYHDRT